MAVREQGYVAQVAPGNTAPLPMADAADFGAAVGAGIGGLGDAVGRYADAQRKFQQNEQASSAAITLEQAKAAAETQEAAAQRGEVPGVMEGGAGYRELIGQYRREQMDKVRGAISDKAVLRQFEPRIAAYLGDGAQRDDVYAYGQAVKKTLADAGERDNLVWSRMERASTIDEYSAQAHDDDAYGASQTNLTPEQQDALALHREQVRAGGFLMGRAKADPAYAQQLLNNSHFDFLSPEMRSSIASTADVYQRRIDNAAKAEKREADAQATSAENAIADQVKAGGTVDSGVLAAAQARARSNGDVTREQDFGQLRARNDTTRAFEPAAVEDVAHEIAKIEGTQDWRASPRLVAVHDQLSTILTQKRNAAPVYTAPLTADPASFRLREQQADVNANMRRSEVLKPLGDDQVSELKDQAASGLAGTMQVAATLGGFRPGYARAAAQQVDSGNAILKRAVSLQPDARAMIVQGQGILKANPQLVDQQDVERAMQASSGALGLTNDLAPEVRAVLPMIAASIANGAGKTKVDKDVMDRAMHFALGGTYGTRGEKQGGIGAWKDHMLVLPAGMTQDEFDSRLASLDVQIDAHAGGHLVPPAEMRARFRPVMGGDGLYRFFDANGGTLKRRDGSDTVVDVRSIPIKARAAPTGPRLPTRREYEASGGAPIEYQRHLQQLRQKWDAAHPFEGQ